MFTSLYCTSPVTFVTTLTLTPESSQSNWTVVEVQTFKLLFDYYLESNCLGHVLQISNYQIISSNMSVSVYYKFARYYHLQMQIIAQVKIFSRSQISLRYLIASQIIHNWLNSVIYRVTKKSRYPVSSVWFVILNLTHFWWNPPPLVTHFLGQPVYLQDLQ